jgi:hypothetical protein
MSCFTSTPAYVRVIDQLGNSCGANNNDNHVFDLNNVPFNLLGSDGTGCSGFYALQYAPVDCIKAGLVTGGIKVRGLIPFDNFRSVFRQINATRGVLHLLSLTWETPEHYIVLWCPRQ